MQKGSPARPLSIKRNVIRSIKKMHTQESSQEQQVEKIYRESFRDVTCACTHVGWESWLFPDTHGMMKVQKRMGGSRRRNIYVRLIKGEMVSRKKPAHYEVLQTPREQKHLSLTATGHGGSLRKWVWQQSFWRSSVTKTKTAHDRVKTGDNILSQEVWS